MCNGEKVLGVSGYQEDDIIFKLVTTVENLGG